MLSPPAIAIDGQLIFTSLPSAERLRSDLAKRVARNRASSAAVGAADRRCVIQRSSGSRGSCAARVDVVDLQTGRCFDIWENRGACARGCRLDERGLLDAEPPIQSAIVDRVDLVVINRFGRAESSGPGARRLLPAALEADIPVLTAVRSPLH